LKVSNIVTGVAERPDDQVGPYPNPFTSSVFIPVSLKSHGPATVIVYNSSGQVIHRSDYDELDAGDHHLEWKPMGENIHEGLFSYMTLTNDGMKTGKIMWTR
jgi:flagellar hook assembly protein FlgD